MARNIGVSLGDPQPVYRAVILKLYPGLHNRELKRYTTEDGTEYLYHASEAYGPYGTRAPATAQVTGALRGHETAIKQGYYTHRNEWNPALGRSEKVPNGTVPEFTAFVEEQTPSWEPVAGTIRKA